MAAATALASIILYKLKKKHTPCVMLADYPQGEILMNGTMDEIIKPKYQRFLTACLYGLIGLAASLALFLLFYVALLFNADITMFIANTYGTPWYFWPYVIFTLGTIVLFGVNISLLVYRARKFGPRSMKGQAGAGAGSLIGIAASACPVCGSTILAAIGISSGLAAFPFQGLELKALSFGLMALSLWLLCRDMKKAAKCNDATCPPASDPSFKKEDWWSIAFFLITVVYFSFIGWNMLRTEPIIANAFNRNQMTAGDVKLVDAITAEVIPAVGFQSKISLGDSIIKLVQDGVIDPAKFNALYKDQGGLPPEIANILNTSSNKPILLTRSNSSYYINLLWPIGLANYLSANRTSPINGKSLFNFASTGGWTLGKEANGGSYFNKFQIVLLTPAEESLVVKIAENTYRPCCNNSTFFQDCNHGSALLGLLELGASQGLSEDELYREALAFNSFWFPDTYIETALYFKELKGVDWRNIDPRLVMGKDYSSISGWSQTVDQAVRKLGVLPQNGSGAGCGV